MIRNMMQNYREESCQKQSKRPREVCKSYQLVFEGGGMEGRKGGKMKA